MKLNVIDAHRNARTPLIGLLAALGLVASGCFGGEEEGYTPGEVASMGPMDGVGPTGTGGPANPGGPAGTGAGVPADPGGTPADPGGTPADPGGTPADPANPTPTPNPMGAGGATADPGGGMGGMGNGSAGRPPVDVDPPPAITCGTECTNGKAGEFGCSGVKLLAHLTPQDLTGPAGNDIWGWTDPMTQKEYALVGLTNGTAFVDISSPCEPVFLGHLKTETVNQTWRDIKVYKDHAFIVAESTGHGMQVFDLTKLRNVANPPATFTADHVNKDFGSTHNIVLNPESGRAYAVAANNCGLGLTFDISEPKNPKAMGCWDGGGRIHDGQCVTYKGPDAAYAGKEICLSGNEGRGVAVYDAADMSAVKQIGAAQYDNISYGHQGWLTEDHKYFLFGDEGDELASKINMTIYVFDVTNLAMPKLHMTYVAEGKNTDHNLYVRGNYAFISAYSAGVRIIDISKIDAGTITEAAFFDTFPPHDNAGFEEQWSNYPYFKSGVLVTNGGEGLFILAPDSMFMGASTFAVQ